MRIVRKLMIVLVALTAIAFSAATNAGWVQGYPVRIYAGPQLGDAVAVQFLPSDLGWQREGRPACSIYDEFALDTSTPGGQRAYALLMLASERGLRIEAYGTGTCTVTGDREDIRFIYTCSSSQYPRCAP